MRKVNPIMFAILFAGIVNLYLAHKNNNNISLYVGIACLSIVISASITKWIIRHLNIK